MGFGVTRAATAGKVVQRVNTQIEAAATGATVLPHDNSIPQITEGNEYMTLAITPTNASNILVIEVEIMVAASAVAMLTAALFVGSTVDALSAQATAGSSSSSPETLSFTHSMVAGVATSLTFRVRAGPGGAATVTFNGAGGVRLYGAIPKSSMTITEFTP